ncbi:hypothetical protein KCU70_g437, partial [Aureobasidium melanogenum]
MAGTYTKVAPLLAPQNANRPKISASTGTSMTVPKSEDGVGQQHSANDWHIYRRQKQMREVTCQATYTTAHVGGAWSLSRKSSSQHFSAAATANSIIMQSDRYDGSRIPGSRYTWEHVNLPCKTLVRQLDPRTWSSSSLVVDPASGAPPELRHLGSVHLVRLFPLRLHDASSSETACSRCGCGRTKACSHSSPTPSPQHVNPPAQPSKNRTMSLAARTIATKGDEQLVPCRANRFLRPQFRTEPSAPKCLYVFYSTVPPCRRLTTLDSFD